jgi:hypothetical protein
MLLAAFVLAGCAESVAGYSATYSGSGSLPITAGPPDGDLVTFRMPRTGVAPSRQPVYARPGRAILKLAGYMPVGPDAVDETEDAYAVSFRLPEDAIRAVKSGKRGGNALVGELLLPFDTGVTSFTGVERHVPGTLRFDVRVIPVYSGPLTALATHVAEFLRGLYAAR